MPTYFSNYADGSLIWCDTTAGECSVFDEKSRIVCKEIEIIACGSNDPSNPCSLAVVNNGTILCDCGDSINCDRCGNDLPFYNIVNEGDDLFFQFQQIDTLNGQDPNGSFSFGWGDFGFINGFVKDCCTGDFVLDSLGNPKSIIAYSGVDRFVGVFPTYDYLGVPTWKNIQTIRIDTALLYADLIAQFPGGNGCFILDFCFNYSNPSSRYCLCSEPFKFNPCPEKKSTVLLEGEYTGFDCFRYYYGTEAVGNGNFSFQNQYRVEGSNEQQNFEIAKEFVGSMMKATTSETIENWLLRTNRVPNRVARLIANILSAPEVYADGYSFIADGEISKNNEIGSQWFIEAKLKRISCNKTFSCK